MTFKLIPRKYEYLEPMTIKIGASTIKFSSDIKEDLGKRPYCNIYMDNEEKKVAFDNTENKETGFKFNGYGSIYLTNTLKKLMPKGIFKVKKEEGKYVIKFKELQK